MRPAELEQSQQKQSEFSIKGIFRHDPAIGVSKFRIHLLRVVFALIAVFLGRNVWTEIFTHTGLWEPLPGIAFSFWAAFSALALLGIRYPLKMIPLLLIQLTYKLIWLTIVAYPLWSASQLSGTSLALTRINLMAVVVDLLVIPWPYVVRSYILGTKKAVTGDQ